MPTQVIVASQLSLFDAQSPLPDGLVYAPRWLSEDDERALIALLTTLPFAAARYKSYTARRRVVGYGGRFDYDTNVLGPAPPLVPALWPLRDRVAAWAGVPPAALRDALVSEYAPGTPLGWHRDVPDFDEVFGVSLGGSATMRWRPYGASTHAAVALDVAPRSIYAMRGAARWRWQHCVAPVPALRWSITFRTRRGADAARR